MENNKVNVKIYGQDYTISGDLPKDEIISHADKNARNAKQQNRSIIHLGS